MQNHRTSSALELLVSLDRQVRSPLRVQLEEQLRAAVRSGRLEPGTALPSSRALARDLGVTRGLIVDCYTQLQAEGYLTAQPGAGTAVAAMGTVSPSGRYSPEPIRAPRWDFLPGRPDPAMFPRRDWVGALRRSISAAPDRAFGYSDPRGSIELREALASYLGRVRGAHADAGRIVICTGFTQAKNLIWRMLRARGATRVALEDPGQLESRRSVERSGLTPVPVPVDELGLRVDQMLLADPDAVLVTPAHQFPTGVVLAAERRLALRDWAQEHDGLIVEDDYDAELRYDREPVGALQGLAPDHVIYCGSASKALGAGLRLGWLLCPPHLTEEIVEEKRAEDRGSPILEQLTLATLLSTGRYDRHLRRVRNRYRGRRDALAHALRQHAPQVKLTGIAAGIHAVATLPPTAEQQQLTDSARRRDVGLYGISAYRWDHATHPPALVLGYGGLTESSIALAIGKIADLLAP
jgi:GntR family transcriptional regulator / MocR family aminotransferase